MRTFVKVNVELQLLVLCLASAVAGQTPDVSLGLEVGLSRATFHGEAVEGLKARSGVTAELMVERRIGGLAWVATGAGWTQKGSRGTLTGFEEALSTDLRIDYVQIPLLIGLRPSWDAAITPIVFAGPSVAFEVSCDNLTPIEELALTLGCPEDGTRKQADWSAVIGGGLEYDAGRATMRLVARYEHGLTQLNDTLDGSFAHIHNRALILRAGVFVPIA